MRGATEYNEPGVLMTFEETPEEITQNVASLGWDLDQLGADGKLIIDHVYIDPQGIQESGDYDLEGLFIRLGSAIQEIGAKRVVLDTLEVLFAGLSNTSIVRSELRRLFRWLKSQGVTAIITGERGDNALTHHGLEEYVSDCVIRLEQRTVEELSTRFLQIFKYRGSRHGTNEYPFLIEENGISITPVTSLELDHEISNEQISTGISRLDTMLDGNGERNRIFISILKSRGMKHSNQVREFLLTSQGVELVDVYLGQRSFLTGTARISQQAQEKLDQLSRQQEFERKKRLLEHQRALVQTQIAALEIQLATDQEELDMFSQQEEANLQILFENRDSMAGLRKADPADLADPTDL